MKKDDSGNSCISCNKDECCANNKTLPVWSMCLDCSDDGTECRKCQKNVTDPLICKATKKSSTAVWVYILIGVGGLLLIIVVAVVIALAAKKKKSPNASGYMPINPSSGL